MVKRGCGVLTLREKKVRSTKMRRSSQERSNRKSRTAAEHRIDLGWLEKHGGCALPIELGNLEYLTIASVARLGQTAYGVSIRSDIKKFTLYVCSTSKISKAISNLEEKGFVKCWMSAPTGERGGRSKRMVRITPSGVRAARRFYRWILRTSRSTPWGDE